MVRLVQASSSVTHPIPLAFTNSSYYCAIPVQGLGSYRTETTDSSIKGGKHLHFLLQGALNVPESFPGHIEMDTPLRDRLANDALSPGQEEFGGWVVLL